jgi:formylglycine-generating enzyme required for sulfatase activity
MQIHFSRTNEIHINSGSDQYDKWGWIEQDLRELVISVIFIATDALSQERMRFVSIRIGSSMMGSPACEAGHAHTETQHHVRLTRHFFMQNTTVIAGGSCNLCYSTGPSSGSGRVMRVGHYQADADGCRFTGLWWLPPNLASDVVGFRLAMVS